MVAATIESGLLEPNDLESMFLMPAASKTALTPATCDDTCTFSGWLQ